MGVKFHFINSKEFRHEARELLRKTFALIIVRTFQTDKTDIYVEYSLRSKHLLQAFGLQAFGLRTECMEYRLEVWILHGQY